MFFSREFRVLRAMVLACVATLAACTTTGNRFDTADLRFLVPGETTLSEATQLLQGEPVNVYRRLDGSAIARWSVTDSLATDAVYFNQELWLAFDSLGRFERIVKSNNVPPANQFRDGRRVALPVPHNTAPAYVPAAAPVLQAAAAPVSQQVAAPASQPVAAPAPQPALIPFASTAVSYPLTQ